jgi:DNA repair exonuclease SbcCD ATPase subunit
VARTDNQANSDPTPTRPETHPAPTGKHTGPTDRPGEADEASRNAELETVDASRDLHDELERSRSELELIRTAHDAQARHLITERLAFADRIEELESERARLREEIEWRTGVMEEYERRLDRIHSSRTFRYTAPLRRLVAMVRRSRK